MSAKKKLKRTVTKGIVHVQVTFNNTIITYSDEQGNPVSFSSGGAVGFKGSKKSTPHAAELAAKAAGAKAKEVGMRTVEIRFNGPGAGRDMVIRAIHNMDFEITGMFDITSVPHNGCRKRKKRRV